MRKRDSVCVYQDEMGSRKKEEVKRMNRGEASFSSSSFSEEVPGHILVLVLPQEETPLAGSGNI